MKAPLMRYKADITAGSLKVAESRIIADLLLRSVDGHDWNTAICVRNVLQARTLATAKRLSRLIRGRLRLMDSDLWRLVRDGLGDVATHAVLAAAVKHSALLGDFLDLVVRQQYRISSPALTNQLWAGFLDDCRDRDHDMPVWNESTRKRLRSSIYQILAQAGYIDNTRSKKLQTVHIASQVISYLEKHDEDHVLRCILIAQ